MHERFPRRLKLLTPSDFDHVFKDCNCKKVGGRYSVMLYRLNQLEWPRLGFVISKKKVKKAVDRNKIRRIVRESFRKKQKLLKSLDIILIARAGLGELDKQQLHDYFEKQWKELIAYQ